MREWLSDRTDLPYWVQRVTGGLLPSAEEAAMFLAAALVLLPPELGLRSSLLGATPVSEPLRAALRELWMRSGMPPPAPMPMPLHRMSPGFIAVRWRRLRVTLAQAFRTAVE